MYDHTGVNYHLDRFIGFNCTWTCRYSTPELLNNTVDLNDCMMKRNCWRPSFYHDIHPVPRQCDTNVIFDCPVDNAQLVQACENYMAKVPNFKNIHCARCHNVSVVFDHQSMCQKIVHVVGESSLTILFDFSPESESLQQSSSVGEKPPACPPGHVFMNLKYCKRVSCPTGAIFTSWGDCAFSKKSTSLTKNILTEVDPRFRRFVIELAAKTDNFTDGDIVEIIQPFWESISVINFYDIKKYNRTWNARKGRMLRDKTSWRMQEHMEPEEKCLQNYTIGYSITIEGLDNLNGHIETWLDSVKSNFVNLLDGRPSCQPGFSFGLFAPDMLLSRVNAANFPDDGSLCNASEWYWPVSYGRGSFVRQERNNTKLIDLYIDMDNISTHESSHIAQEAMFTGGSVFYNFWRQKKANWSRSDRVVICERMPLCPLIDLHETQYKWRFDDDGNASLGIISSGRIVSPDKIMISHDGQMKVCLSTSLNYGQLTDDFNGQNIATNIGCGVSLTLLGIVIITYLSFSELRNIPGKTIMNLSISLCLAQGLLVFGTGQTMNYAVCFIIATMMHLSWLSVFSWANVLAFDLSRTFGKRSKMRRNDDGSSTFVRYSLYGWGVPVVLVAVTAVIHYCAPIERYVTNVYDLATVCWIRSGYPLLVAFGCPVAIVLVLNIAFFARTVFGIRSTMKATKILKKENDKDADMKQLKKELRLYALVSRQIGSVCETKNNRYWNLAMNSDRCFRSFRLR